MGIVIDALGQTAISQLWGAVTNLLNETKDYILNAKDALEKLQMTLKKFQKAIKDADLKPFFNKERDRDLEVELKDVLYDAEDIIEEYRSKIEVSKRDQVRKRSWTTAFTSFYEDASFRYQLGNKIKKINERLDEIKKDWDIVYRLKTTPKGDGEDPVHGEHDNPRETTHHIGVQLPIGRENDKKVLVEKLSSNDSTQSSTTEKGCASIISIVGKGGIGKTTLAKLVFNEVEQQFEGRRWWVCVSERPNRKDLMRKILKEVRKESKEDVDSSLSDLCTQLQKELSKEKFLLVLDDVWELKCWWEGEVGGSLTRGAMGSKILITSRKQDVSDGMRASYMHQLPEFNFHQSWDLFLKEALSEGQTEQDLVIHNVRDVGESIVKKCGGLPLVIKTVGSMMRTKKMSRDDWKFVEDSEIWRWNMPAASSSSTEIGGDILPGLMLSYDDLPYYLKSCFVYSCIYPKDYEIKRERLIMQWIAHGLIEEKQGIDVEATANQYIEDLIRLCLIEKIDLKKIKLHDILHDLVLYIGRREYSHTLATEHTRHLSLLGVYDAEAHKRNALETTNKVRTLLADSNSYLWVYIEHLSNFKWLRVLSLRRCQNIHELPNSFECLSLLKYLDLYQSDVRRLPSSIGRLCNLQTLDLSDSRIEELPKEMVELCNLRYLGLERTFWLTFIAEGLGKLTNLQTLHRFLVCDDKGNTKGCNIGELKDLNKLKGELSIEGLGGARKAIDCARNAQLLKEKHGIISLRFDYGIAGDDDKQSDASEQRRLLEALEPPVGLECLKISDYKGQMPAWHLKTEYAKLHSLKLKRCHLWEKQISITSLKVLKVITCLALCEIASMPALERMAVTDCGSLKQLPHHMPALRSLEVKDCGSLEQLPDHMPALKSLMMNGCNSMKILVHMPALEWLEMAYCGSLEQLPHDMSALKSLKVDECYRLKTVSFMPALERLNVKHCGSLEQLPHDMPALKSLNVYGCNRLKTLDNMPALQSLEVSWCGSLHQLPHDNPALKLLKVYGCNRLKTLVNMPALESLEVSWCGSLEQLSHDMPTLKSLKVYGCNMLETVANMPALELLEVKDCGSLEQLPHGMPALKSLKVDGRNRLKTVTSMPALESLEVKDCGSLEQVADMPALNQLNVDRCNMLKTAANIPALKRLRLSHLNTLKWLPSRLPSLEELTVLELPNWEGWPASGSRETTFTSMSCLREAKFLNCPKMQTQGLMYALSQLAGHEGQATQLRKLSVQNCPSARLGWKLLEQLPNLIELMLDSKSAALLPSPLPSEVSTFLPSLKTLELRDTDIDHKVKWGRVPQWLWGLSQLEQLYLYSFSEDISLEGHWQCLPKMRTLRLSNFPNLKSLVDVNNITPQQNETICPVDTQQQIACLFNLQSLNIFRCPALDLPQLLKDHLGPRLTIV